MMTNNTSPENSETVNFKPKNKSQGGPCCGDPNIVNYEELIYCYNCEFSVDTSYHCDNPMPVVHNETLICKNCIDFYYVEGYFKVYFYENKKTVIPYEEGDPCCNNPEMVNNNQYIYCYNCNTVSKAPLFEKDGLECRYKEDKVPVLSKTEIMKRLKAELKYLGFKKYSHLNKKEMEKMLKEYKDSFGPFEKVVPKKSLNLKELKEKLNSLGAVNLGRLTKLELEKKLKLYEKPKEEKKIPKVKAKIIQKKIEETEDYKKRKAYLEERKKYWIKEGIMFSFEIKVHP